MYNVYVFLNQNIENETNYRGKRILDKHINTVGYRMKWVYNVFVFNLFI